MNDKLSLTNIHRQMKACIQIHCTSV